MLPLVGYIKVHDARFSSESKMHVRIDGFNNSIPSLNAQVFEGERSLTKDCRLLGKFDLSGIPPAPRLVSCFHDDTVLSKYCFNRYL